MYVNLNSYLRVVIIIKNIFFGVVIGLSHTGKTNESLLVFNWPRLGIRKKKIVSAPTCVIWTGPAVGDWTIISNLTNTVCAVNVICQRHRARKHVGKSKNPARSSLQSSEKLFMLERNFFAFYITHTLRVFLLLYVEVSSKSEFLVYLRFRNSCVQMVSETYRTSCGSSILRINCLNLEAIRQVLTITFFSSLLCIRVIRWQ